MDVVRCAGLTKRYGSTTVVDRLDLSVAPGEIVGFLGRNGAGKTTTLRMLLGLIRPDAGSAWLFGDPVPCPDRLPAVGAMIEEPAFYPWLTGTANLTVLADTGPPVPADAITRALERAGLAEAAGTKVKTYSQGMRQRLGLAAALLREPRLLLLDEPANGLDPPGLREFRETLRGLAGAGSAILLSSHLLGELDQICDRVVLIDGGRLIATVRPGELPAPRSTITVRSADRDRATSLLAADGIEVKAMGPERPSLEDWFITLTEKDDHASAPR
ncbi:MAG: transporter related protein [Streptosporangiaceae bacterium]|jgi:ABC-2 type transport system ATP-binding protein|nr:transporter related protein [Streptosporangiaceae bacterium]